MEKITAEERLYTVAEAQHGYFTTQQAIQAGFQDATHPYHTRVGHWIREDRGIYRLAYYPFDKESEYVRWVLWTRNRNGIVLGVYSHETALSMYELSDINPSKLHISVPRGFRRNRQCPEIITLHLNDIPESEIQEREGYKVSKPVRTIADLLKEEKISLELVLQAIRSSISRGLLSQSQLKKLCFEFPYITQYLKGLL